MIKWTEAPEGAKRCRQRHGIPPPMCAISLRRDPDMVDYPVALGMGPTDFGRVDREPPAAGRHLRRWRMGPQDRGSVGRRRVHLGPAGSGPACRNDCRLGGRKIAVARVEQLSFLIGPSRQPTETGPVSRRARISCPERPQRETPMGGAPMSRRPGQGQRWATWPNREIDGSCAEPPIFVSIPPEAPVGCQLDVAHRVLHVPVTEVRLQRPGIVGGIGERVAAGMAQHVRVHVDPERCDIGHQPSAGISTA
jgi:hypothetical protein